MNSYGAAFCHSRIGTWKRSPRPARPTARKMRVPHQEVPRAVAGDAPRLGHRDRGRIHHHQPDREQQQRRPHERRVVGGSCARRAARAGPQPRPMAESTCLRQALTHARAPAARAHARRETLAALDVVRGTCRGSRRPATAARRRRARASATARVDRGSSVPTRLDAGRRACERALRSRGASRPISTTARQSRVDRGLERREILALAVAARDQHHRPRDAVERRLRRADVVPFESSM